MNNKLISIIVILIGELLSAMAVGIISPKLATIIESQTSNAFYIGLSSSTWAIGIIFGRPIAQYLDKLNQKLVLIALVSFCAFASLGYYANIIFLSLLIQVIAGFIMGYYTIKMEKIFILNIENKKNIGFYLSIFSVLSPVGFMIGGLLISVEEYIGNILFFLAFVFRIFIVPTIIPLQFSTNDSGLNNTTQVIKYHFKPMIIILLLFSGLIACYGFGVGNLYLLRLGYDSANVALIMTSFFWGEVILALIFGKLTDVVGLANSTNIIFIALILSSALILYNHDIIALIIGLFVVGGISVSLYNNIMTHISNEKDEGVLDSALYNALKFYSIGAVVFSPFLGIIINYSFVEIFIYFNMVFGLITLACIVLNKKLLS